MTTSIETYRHTFQTRLQRQSEAREKIRQRVLQTVLTNAPDVVAGFPSIQRAYLFGSLTHYGAFHAQSDVDIAVEGATAEEYFALWHALEEMLPDVGVDLRDLIPDTYFGKQVCQRGILLYERGNSVTSGGNSR